MNAGRSLAPGLLVLMLVLFGAAPGMAQTLTQLPVAALRDRAEAGDTAAQYELALRYDQGRGVAQNFVAARPWLVQAAEGGNRAAQHLLGLYHARRIGGAEAVQDQAQAEHWLGLAAQAPDTGGQTAGTPEALFDLARILETPVAGDPDPAAAAALYSRAAAAGHAEAAVSLGVLYQAGRGVAQDYAAARSLYETAASRGQPRALNNLGLLYVRGHGVTQDYAVAAGLFEQAAALGLAEGVRNLGVMYENGFGVAQDDARAAELYRQAAALVRPDSVAALPYRYDARLAPAAPGDAAWRAEALRAARAGDPLGQYMIGWLALQEGGARDAAVWLRRAALKGMGPAMHTLGLMYTRGEGLPQDYVLGYMWLSLAVSAGVPGADVAVALLLPRLTPDQLQEAQSRTETQWDAMDR